MSQQDPTELRELRERLQGALDDIADRDRQLVVEITNRVRLEQENERLSHEVQKLRDEKAVIWGQVLSADLAPRPGTPAWQHELGAGDNGPVDPPADHDLRDGDREC